MCGKYSMQAINSAPFCRRRQKESSIKLIGIYRYPWFSPLSKLPLYMSLIWKLYTCWHSYWLEKRTALICKYDIYFHLCLLFKQNTYICLRLQELVCSQLCNIISHCLCTMVGSQWNCNWPSSVIVWSLVWGHIWHRLLCRRNWCSAAT